MWHYHNPVAIHGGVGALDMLPAIVRGRRAILITFPEARELGLCERIAALLGDRLAVIETGVRPNPDVAWLAPLYERLWREHPDAECVIGVGGGSVIDCAKVMMTRTLSGGFAELLAHLAAGAPAPGLPGRALIAVPTTAGTGSEVTPWATVWDTVRESKYSLHLPSTWPEAAIVDPALMASLPAAVTLASGLDALSHALEALWNIHRNPVSSGYAVRAARGILETLPALIAQPARIDLRDRVARAALEAGLAFSNTRTALAHSLSYGITLERGVAHGIACSFSLPRVLKLAAGHDASVDTLLCDIFDAPGTDAAASRLTAFLERLGVCTDPAAYGVPSHQWEQRVAEALAGPRGRNFIGARRADG